MGYFMIDSWIFLNSFTPFIDKIYKLSRLINYNVTSNKLIRGIVPLELQQKICQFYDLDLDVGIYKTPPGWKYKFHKDNTRNCAFNQLLCEPNLNYVNQMMVNEKIENIPYDTDRLCLINTAKFHNVQNNTTDTTRYLLNMGVNHFITFEVVENHLKDRGFI
jgi:hypothetical protein